jgi:hypothetical protein
MAQTHANAGASPASRRPGFGSKDHVFDLAPDSFDWKTARAGEDGENGLLNSKNERVKHSAMQQLHPKSLASAV